MRALRLTARIQTRTYCHPRGREFAFHGFSRRLSLLKHCVFKVFEVLPAHQHAEPDEDNRFDATINLQAFVFNTFGAIDNLAWVWAYERLADAEGEPTIGKSDVALNKAKSPIRSSFSEPFREYLDEHMEWFRFQEDYRHSLAHRIPLYIPPSAVPTEKTGVHASLGEEMIQAALRGDPVRYDQLMVAQKELAVFLPVMIHSFGEEARPVFFHPQMICDFETVEELARRFFDELDASGK
jgi:hypothetical protein